jgi:hypothetical protein
LVSLSVMVVAEGAYSSYQSVSEESVTRDTELLIDNLFVSEFIFVKVFEYVLSDFSLLGCRSPSKMVEVTVKPVVYSFVDFIVMITNFLGSLFLLHGLGLSGSAIFIGTTNIKCVVTSESAIPCKHIGR